MLVVVVGVVVVKHVRAGERVPNIFPTFDRRSALMVSRGDSRITDYMAFFRQGCQLMTIRSLYYDTVLLGQI